MLTDQANYEACMSIFDEPVDQLLVYSVQVLDVLHISLYFDTEGSMPLLFGHQLQSEALRVLSLK